MGWYADTQIACSRLKREAIDLFKEKALRRHRLTEEETKVDDTILMENLHLFDEEGYLIRAAMLAFYKDLEKLFESINLL